MKMVAITRVSRLLASAAFLALTACASVSHRPAVLDATGVAGAPPRALSVALEITLDTGFSRTLRAGSRWQRVGAIAEGAVYQPYEDVFTLEGAHIHEAYLVVDKETLVGFYLPAERGFSPLTHSLPVHFN